MLRVKEYNDPKAHKEHRCPSQPPLTWRCGLSLCLYTQTLRFSCFLATAQVPDGLFTAQACTSLAFTQPRALLPRETQVLGGEEPAEAPPTHPSPSSQCPSGVGGLVVSMYLGDPPNPARPCCPPTPPNSKGDDYVEAR